MDDRTTGTTGSKRTSRRSSTSAAPDVIADDTSSISSDLYGGSGINTEQDRSFMGRVRERASEQLNTQKNRATEGLGTAASAVRQSTQRLRDEKHDTIAQYIESAADQLDRFANRVKNKNVTELLDDAQRFARRQPALFIGAAFVLGLIGSRFFKSSSPDRRMTRMYGGDDYRRADLGRPAYGTAVGTTGGSTPGASGASGVAGSTGTSGSVSGSPRDVPGTENF